MKKNFIYPALFLTGMAIAGFTAASCSDDDENVADGNDGGNTELDAAADLDYNAENAASWRNYSLQVAKLLEKDAATLYDSWETSYQGGEAFKKTFTEHKGGSYTSALSCVEEIIDKCVEITDEVGNSKIGDPYDKWTAGRQTEALYAVESWYSFHSRDDYANNIRSIRNSYFNSTDSTISDYSLYKLVEKIDPELNARIASEIESTKNAILAIPQPFRNHIGDARVPVAQAACVALGETLDKQLKSAVENAYRDGEITDEGMDSVVSGFVNKVVLPTYKDLKEKNTALCAAVQNLYDAPSNDTFKAACYAWLEARVPWERSEAFLFGPVDYLSLDPNMDSWPLDQDAIVGILNSGNFDDLNWEDGDTEDEIVAKQEVRGFHTLEFLLFKNGNARTVPAQ